MRRTLFPVAHAFHPVNALLADTPFARTTPAADTRGIATPQVDVTEDDKAVHVKVDLPGLTENDIEVTFDKGVLRIAGEKTASNDDNQENVRTHLIERRYTRFERRLPVGENVDAANIEATFKDGTLTVDLPKTEPQNKDRKIEIKKAA